MVGRRGGPRIACQLPALAAAGVRSTRPSASPPLRRGVWPSRRDRRKRSSRSLDHRLPGRIPRSVAVPRSDGSAV